MYQILTLNKISPLGLDHFDKAKYQCGGEQAAPDGIVVRSASMHDMELPVSLKAIARAGAGVNNIPVDVCSEKGIVVFNTPGANANAVKEMVIAGLLLSARKVIPAIEWAGTLKGQGDQVGKLVEKGKGQFVGPELAGKKLGVIGLGAIGVLVANCARHLGMKVYGYDPYLSVDAAWKLSRDVVHAKNVKEIYENCDFISVHVPLNAGTKGMINSEAIKLMRPGVRVLNFSRDGLVESADMLEALAAGKVERYVTDFPTEEMLGVENVVAIPHLGASTPESEDNCAEMAVLQLMDYLENGNIVNSVNLPSVSLGQKQGARIGVIHKNIPNMLSQITQTISTENMNIANMMNKSKGDHAYTLLDIEGAVGQPILDKIKAIDGVIRVSLY
ncbi:MAG: phosphoglycerate dehydrogenase [Oscillospiraceae bacterium]|jgi:D-3-phosphoglycerate dehydrogenase|nr:phosphoglycerate dehydrogenase [Oscillospiraceae bacterium]MDY4191190.1 phosphoglycerate dehydrogenase [Oscillospiraceae bacterium]